MSATAERVPYTQASVSRDDAIAAYESILSDVGPNYAAPIRRFEDRFASFIGVDFGLATSSCTGALHLALAALGIGPGDEVILADTNWVATVAPVVHVGARPVFVDIDPISWCIDPVRVEEAITPRTRAVIATHIYGNVAAVDSLACLTRDRGLALIEDAAEAIGSRLRGQHVGSFGDVAVFSFHGTKTISTGEGGMVVSSDARLMDRMRILADHGRDPSEERQFWPSEIGFKYKMAPVLAAVGLSQLARVEELIAGRQRVLEHYRSAFGEQSGIRLNHAPSDVEHGAWMPTLEFLEETGITRDDAMRHLSDAGVGARVVFWPLSSTPPFTGMLHAPTPNSYRFSRSAVNLPSSSNMDEDALACVVEAVRSLMIR